MTFNRIQHSLATLLRFNRRWRMLTIRKLLYLPRILTGQEKRFLLLLLSAALASGTVLAVRAYIGLTHPVPQPGGSYTEGVVGTPQAINPIYASTDADRDLARLTFSGLFGYDGSGEIRPDLAERYEVSADGKVYTVVLRENLEWHDGEPLTADDVVFTIKRIQQAPYKSPFRLNWQGVDIEKLDPRTIRFTLRASYAPFIENLTQGIIPRHLWEKIEPAASLLHELNLNPIGSGPYRTKRFKSSGAGSLLWYTLTRNPSYHREGPYLKEITFVFFDNEEEMRAAWHREEIEGFGPISRLGAKELSPDKAKIISLATPRIFSIFLNQRQSPILADKKVRAALAHALNKEQIAEEATAGGGIAISTLLPPLKGVAADQVRAYAYDPSRGRALLEEAGWKDEDKDGIYEKKIKEKKKSQTVKLEFRLSTGNSPELLRAAGRVKEMLREIGAEVVIEERSFAELESLVIRPRNFQLLLFGQVYGYEPDPFAFWHSSQIKDPGLNVAFFAHKQADRLLEDARRTADTAKRTADYQEFIRIAAEELPAIPLYTQVYLYLLPRDMEGISISKISLPSDRFNQITEWYRKTKRVFR